MTLIDTFISLIAIVGYKFLNCCCGVGGDLSLYFDELEGVYKDAIKRRRINSHNGIVIVSRW